MGRFGYKGIETALNGLTLWIENNTTLVGSAGKRHEQCCKIIIEYGKANIPGYKKKGHLATSANYVAKKIEWNKKFQHFTEWVLKNQNNDQ